MIKPVAFALILAVLGGSVHADIQPAPNPDRIYLETGSYHSTFKLKGSERVDVTIEVIPYRARFPHGPKIHVRWGTDGGVPETLIGKLDVKINGFDTALELADYDYLGNPVTLTARQDGDDYIVLLSGGDAAGSYDAKWFFRYSKKRSEYVLRQRILQAGEFPEVHEITDYTSYEGAPWPQR